MSKLPLMSGRAVVRALEKIGYELVRQRGSHIRLQHTTRRSVTVPDHETIGKGLLHKILKTVDLSLEEFEELL